MAHPILQNGLGSPQSTQAVSTDQKHEIGTGAYLPGGKVWYYAKHTGAGTLTRGELLVAEDLAANHQNLATATGALSVGSNSVPAGNITLGATALTANQYADGELHVVDGGGEGTSYKIRSHDAGTSAGTDFTLDLYDSIVVASDADTEVTLVQNKYTNPQQSNTDNADVVLGVPNVAVPAGSTNAQYFWVQTQGYCPAFVVGTPAVGTNLMVSDTTAGMMELRAETDLDATVAFMVTVGITGEVQVVDLQIQGL